MTFELRELRLWFQKMLQKWTQNISASGVSQSDGAIDETLALKRIKYPN